MGRISASIGAAFGTGISGGITQRRRENAQRKRDERLEASVMNRIRQEQTNRLERDAAINAANDIDRANAAQAEDTLWRGVLEARDIPTKNIPFGLTQQSASVMLTARNKKEALDRTLELYKSDQNVRVSLFKMATDFASKNSEGGKKVTTGEKKQLVEAAGASKSGSLSLVQEVIDLAVGKLPSKTALEKDLETEMKLLNRVFTDRLSTNKQKNAAMQKVLDLRQKVRVEQGIADPEELRSPLENLEIAVQQVAGGQNISEQEAFQLILDSQDEAAQKATLTLAAGSAFFPSEEPGFFESLGNVLSGARKRGKELSRLREEERVAATTPQKRRGVLEELTAGGRGKSLIQERAIREQETITPLPDANIEPSVSGLGTSILPPPTTITPFGRKKKKR